MKLSKSRWKAALPLWPDGEQHQHTVSIKASVGHELDPVNTPGLPAADPVVKFNFKFLVVVGSDQVNTVTHFSNLQRW